MSSVSIALTIYGLEFALTAKKSTKMTFSSDILQFFLDEWKDYKHLKSPIKVPI